MRYEINYNTDTKQYDAVFKHGHIVSGASYMEAYDAACAYVGTFEAAVEAAKQRASGYPKWIKAIDRAVDMLRNGATARFDGDYCYITNNNNTYAVNGRCNCTAAQKGNEVCKHRAAKRLLQRCADTASLGA